MLDDDPNKPTKYEGLIINTLLKAKNEGKAENTLNAISTRHKKLRNITL